MKKITNFIIEKRCFILVLFTILSIIAAFFSSKVVINYDLSRYLPNTSETRIGMDIMAEEFAGTETSALNLMFKDLKEEEKESIHHTLEAITGVDSVDYDSSENYNKDSYTLYILNVDGAEDSQQATEVYQKIESDYEDYEFYTSGTIAERNKTVLPAWIVGLAIICVFVILIIMCESYVEPFLFLMAILVAILLNHGTNVLFKNVSHITNSITAILQLALSMDYSIMLMNRYEQEKQKQADKVEAMKEALYHAFTSISSSSITTMVGLLALVFMSFTIGKDLGFVLAKGVLFSLISIFFVLPALILLCDKWITKTKKKSPTIAIDWLGKLSFQIRHIAIFLFIGIFALSYFLKGNLTILYTDSEENEISKIFPENNQIAIVYKNENEEKIRHYLDALEAENQVDQVLAYGNTIDKKLNQEQLNEKLEDLGADINIEPYLLKILYYHYYNQAENNTMTFNDFITFIQTEIYPKEDMKDKIDDETKANIDRLQHFTTEDSMKQKRTIAEIASILEIETSDVEDVLIYYNAKHNNLKISLKDFIDFINRDVLTNEKYASHIDTKTRESLNTLSQFTCSETIEAKMSSNQMADLFGMNPNTMSDLYNYYVSVGNIDTKMTLAEFSNFVLNHVLTNPQYANQFDETIKNNLTTLNTFSNPSIITQEMKASQLANLLGLEENAITQLLFLKYSTMETGATTSLPQLIQDVVYLKHHTHYLDTIDTRSLEALLPLAQNENQINTTKLNQEALSHIFNPFRKGLVGNIYLLTGLPDNYQMTPQEFINLVLKTLTPTSHSQSLDESAFSVDEATLKQLALLKLVIDESISNTPTQYTEAQLAQILPMDTNKLYPLYALQCLTQNHTSHWTASPVDFVNLILNNTTNPSLANHLNESNMAQLTLLSRIMAGTLENKNYHYQELAELVGIAENSSKNIYTLYIIHTCTTHLTPSEFVDFLLTHQTDPTLASNLSANTLHDLILIQSVINGVKNNKVYTSLELSDLFSIPKNDLDLLYGLYLSTYTKPNQTISLKSLVDFLLESVLTNPDYSDSFDTNTQSKLQTIQAIMDASLADTEYTKDEIFTILAVLTDSLDKDTVNLLYVYYGSVEEYQDSWELTVQELVDFLNDKILNDSRFEDFIQDDMRQKIIDSKTTIQNAKNLLLGKEYSRIVLNTKFAVESPKTFEFIQNLQDTFGKNMEEVYVIGNSPMAYEMSQSFNSELNFITVLTMLAIFVVIAFTFRSILVPLILVLTIQCAVYLTMGILSVSGGSVYFIALLIVQSILMGATIDYAILYTSYYIEHRKTMNIKEAIIHSYRQSIHTILTSATILVIVTLIVGYFASAIAAKICKTVSQGTFCSTLIILLLLPAVIASFDKIIMRKHP